MNPINHNSKIIRISNHSSVDLGEPRKQASVLDKVVDEELNRLCYSGLAVILIDLNVVDTQFEHNNFIQLARTVGIASKYDMLFEEIIHELEEREFIRVTNGIIQITDAIKGKFITIDAVIDELDKFALSNASYRDHVRLVSHCFKAYTDILKGKQKATDIIFPLGSLQLVEGIYQGNAQADYFNGLLEDTVVEGVSNALKSGEKIKILEIGAGTGGTTKGLLKKLKGYENSIEYVFTDLSKSFLYNAKSTFGADWLGFRTELLNAEQDPILQGFELGEYDFVIAANVLHATKEMEITLTNIKRLLKRDGVLIVNEIAKKELFTTITFGLLDGWWMYEDEELRLKNNPGLSAENWALILDEVGFENVLVYPAENTYSQQIIAAKSNGNVVLEETIVDKKETLSNQQVVIEKSNDEILHELKEIFAKLLQSEVSRVNIDASFEELGIDSILIGTLSKELSEKFGEIPSTVFFEYVTIQELCNYLKENHSQVEVTKTGNTESAPVFVNHVSQDNSEEEIEKYLKQLFADLLQHDAKKIDVNAPLEELGIDSIMVGSLSRKITEKVGEIPSTVFFEFSTIAELTNYFQEHHSDKFNASIDQIQLIEQDTVALESEIIENKNSRMNSEDPIAIIGLSGKYPGADNVEELWKNLLEGKDSISEIPIERWDNSEFYDELKGKSGKNYCPYGGFINGVDEFDPLFFNISPREAEKMDPQERLFLQTAWEAVEDAGYKAKDLGRRSKRYADITTGVYVGVMYEEYQLHGAIMDPDSGRVALGGNPAGIANRVSYCLDLNGPSMAVDTMCSSSLTSLHLACNDIKSGDVDVAIAGGVNLTVHPNKYLVLSQSTFLSPKGRCESFGNHGEGFVPGEGVGAVLLKRLSQAIADGDHIYATIKGTAIGHGGKGNGYTVPNPAAQAKVIQSAMKRAGVTGDEVSYVEAHGTGTVLGDPIEIEGLNRAFNSNNRQFCKIGSIKSNIGHCESAAGISGLTKVLLQMKHKQIVPSLHAAILNSKIDFEKTPFQVQQELEAWNVQNDKPRIAGLSGFGAGGSNAHIVLEEYPVSPIIGSDSDELIVLSAKNRKSLKNGVARLLNFVSEHTELSISDMAYTLQTGREEMDHRLAFVCKTRQELIEGLKDYQADKQEIVLSGNVREKGQQQFSVDASISNERKQLIDLAQQWIGGETIDFTQTHSGKILNKISLPTYAFQTNKYWFDSFIKKNTSKKITVQKESDDPVPVVIPRSELTEKANKPLVKSVYSSQTTNALASRQINGVRTEISEDGVAIIYMEALPTKNTFTYDFVDSLHASFSRLRNNPKVKVVVLSGYDNVFAMGGAKEGLLDLAKKKGRYTDLPFIYRGLLEFDLPVIAAIQGHAFGGGLVFGLYADLVVLSKKATYTANFMNYGFTPGMGATYIMEQKLGKSIANEMLLTGRMYSGEDLSKRGVQTPVVDDVMKEALKIARELSAKPIASLKLLKTKIADDILAELDKHIAKEIEMQELTFGAPEVRTKIIEQFQGSSKGQVVLESAAHTVKNKEEVVPVFTKISLASPSSMVNEKHVANSESTRILVKLDETVVEKEEVSISTPIVKSPQFSELEIEGQLKEIVADTLYLDVADILSTTPITELGLDSINGVEILREINALFGTSLEGSVLYEYGTIKAFAEMLLAEKPKMQSIEVVKESVKPPVLEPIITNEVVVENANRIVLEPTNVNVSSTDTKQSLKEIIAAALHLQADEIENSTPFVDLGMDSINGVEILREINDAYNLQLEGSVLYDYATIHALADYVASISEGNTVTKEEIPEKILLSSSGNVSSRLIDIIGQCLHLTAEEIEVDINFAELGMDSINGVEIIREINQEFDAVLEANDLYEYPNIGALASKLGGDKPATQVIEKTIPATAIVVNKKNKIHEPFDLSYMQQAYWVGESAGLELGGKQAHLTVQFAYASFDPVRLNSAVDELMQRHELLRAHFLPSGKQQVQENLEPFKVKVEHYEELSEKETEERLNSILKEKTETGPDKFKSPLFDITLIKNGNEDLIVVNLSLLICDGLSVSIFFKDLFSLYFQPEVQLPKLSLKFKDYIDFLAEQKQSDKYRESKKYWQERLDSLPLGPELAYNHGSENGVMIHKEKRIDSAIFQKLKAKANKSNISLAVLMCTVYTKVLAYYARNPHFSLTMMTLGRDFPDAEINGVIGNFSRISVLELDYSQPSSFIDELRKVTKQIWADQKYATYNGIEVIRDLNVERGIIGKTAVPMTFASAFGLGYDQSSLVKLKSASMQVPQVAMDHQVCEEVDGRLLISFDVEEGFFQKGVTHDIIASYEQLIIQLADANWEQEVEKPLLVEQLSIIKESNDTADVVSEDFLYTPFVRQAKSNPDKVALFDGKIEKKYGEIEKDSNRIANLLRKKKVGPNDLVGVMMNKGWEQVPSTIGVMKSGGAYLPIDPSMPHTRLDYITEKANVKFIIVTKAVIEAHVEMPTNVEVLIYEESFADSSDSPLYAIQKNTDLAYTIFTSGSTGFPKGVMIDHRGALNTCLDINERFAITEDDRVLALSALYFDLSVYDLFGVLGAGGAVVFPDEAKLTDPSHWIDLVQNHKVTIWNSVPELMNMFIEYNSLIQKKQFDGLKLIMMSGDWIPIVLPEKIKAVVPNAKVISLGGATEASIWSIYHPIIEIDPDLKSIPYGKALKNQTMHVLNDQLEPCPFLTIGNIYIGGVGVAKGYLKDEEKTNNQFIRDPKSGEIIYKTGDLGRVLRNGDIEFLGREDFQVKVQGYRIELGDIEVTLLRSKKIQTVVVVVKKDTIGNNYLVAYVVPEHGTVVSEDELKDYLKNEIQGYMIPKYIVSLEELPKSKNGKIDRKNLPDPRSRDETDVVSVPVSEEVTTSLKSIWKELLDISDVKTQEDFFELGGNSLLAIRLVAKIESEMNVLVELSDILQHSSFGSLESLLHASASVKPEVVEKVERIVEPQKEEIVAEQNVENVVEKRSIVRLKNPNGNGNPLFLVHPIGGSVFCYNGLAKGIDSDTPIYGFHATGDATPSVSAMAAKYIREMREVQFAGPYKIGGWSFGGIIAFEMTQQLEKEGEEVENLYLIDSYFHTKGYDFSDVSEATIFQAFLRDLTYQRGGIPIVESTMEEMLKEAVSQELFPSEMTMSSIQKLLQVFRSNCIAYSSYSPTNKVDCNAHLITANDTSYIGSKEQLSTWESWLNNEVNHHPLAGDHFTIFEGESLTKITEVLNQESKLIHS